MTTQLIEPTQLVIGRARANRAHGLSPAVVRDACGPRVYVAPVDGRLWAVGMYWAAPVEILEPAAKYLPEEMTTTAGCYLASGGRFRTAAARAVPDPEALLTDALASATDLLAASDRYCRGDHGQDPAVILTDTAGTERCAASVRYLHLLAGCLPTTGVAAVRSGRVDVTGALGMKPLVLRQRRAWADGSPCDDLLGLLMPVHLGERR